MASARKTESLSLGAAFIGVLFFSTGPVIVANADTSGLTLATWRVILGTLVVAPVAIFRGEFSKTIFTKTIVAGIGFGTASALFFEAAQLTSVANAALIAVLQPVPLLIAGILFFGERVTRTETMWVAMAVVGAVIMVVSSSTSGTGDIKGDLVAVASMLMTAVYFVGSKQARQSLDTLPFMVGLWFWSTVVLVPIVLISGQNFDPGTADEWLRVVGVALLPGAGHFLINYSHRATPLSVVGVLQLFIPVGATILALFLLDQDVSVWQWIGMGVVIVSLVTYTTIRTRRDESTEVVNTPADARSSRDG
ncbi:MAG: DMT family transporter [Acidimicrobiales bacterium]